MKKQNHKAPHIPRYNLSLAEIKSYAFREMEKEIPRLSSEIADLLLVTMLETLTLETKFEPKRIQKICERLENVLKCRSEGFVDLQEIKNQLNKEFGTNLKEVNDGKEGCVV